MTKIASKRFFLWWGFILLLCASPLGIIAGVVLGIPVLMVVSYLFISTRAVCSWISHDGDCWFSLTQSGANHVDWPATMGVALAGYGLIVAYIAFCAYRAHVRGQTAQSVRQARVALNMFFLACAVCLAFRMTLIASSGM